MRSDFFSRASESCTMSLNAVRYQSPLSEPQIPAYFILRMTETASSWFFFSSKVGIGTSRITNPRLPSHAPSIGLPTEGPSPARSITSAFTVFFHIRPTYQKTAFAASSRAFSRDTMRTHRVSNTRTHSQYQDLLRA